jgi:uncharacterized protein (DUF58 family)
LQKVKSRLFLQSRRHALHQLDGQYRSQARGRGMDFDDLREYEPGDDVRDIDWKATARHSAALIRRYHAERRHVVTFVVDSGRSMAAESRTREHKRDIAVLVVGAMGYLSTKHGDDVALHYGDSVSTNRIAPGRSEAHLERMLRAIDSYITGSSGSNDLESLLAGVHRTARRKEIIVCVSDETPLSDDTIATIRRLRANHDLIWVTVGDSELTGFRARQRVTDVETAWEIPEFVLARRDVVRSAVLERDHATRQRQAALDSAAVPNATVHSEDDVLPALIALLAKRGHARG